MAASFTVLYGSHSASTPPCYLLEIPGCSVLLDCGWDAAWDPALLEPLRHVAKSVSLVLVSHADVEHMGALPWARRHLGLVAPVYATTPVVRMGTLALYDAVLGGGAPYSLDDVDTLMGGVSELKYEQPVPITLGEGKDKVEVRCYASGRSLGGAVWRISQEAQSLNLLYASDVLHRSERFLDGLDFKRVGKAPTLLIQDILGVSLLGTVDQPPPKTRDAQMLERVLSTLRSGGDVLIPVDSTSRVLEILLLLDERWQREMLEKSYDLVYYTQISSIFDVASSHVEWCSKQLQAQLDAAAQQGYHNNDPFRVMKVSVVDSVDRVFSSRRPRVVVCMGTELSRRTPAREVFLGRIASNPNSCVLFVLPPVLHSSLASQVIRGARVVTVDDEQPVELEGEERLAWEAKARARLEERERERAAEREIENFENNNGGEDDDTTAANNSSGGGVPMAVDHQADAVAPPSPIKPSRLDSSASVATATSMVPPTPAQAAAGRDDHLQRMSSQASLQQQQQLQQHGSGGDDFLTLSYPPQPMYPMPVSTTTAGGARWDEYGGFINVEELMDEEAKLKHAAELEESGGGDGGGSGAEKSTTATTAGGGGPTLTPEQAEAEAELLARLKARGGDLARGGSGGDDDADLDLSKPPTKMVPTTVQCPIACKVFYIDFSGRAATTDLFEIVDLIKPKKLIVVRAGQTESELFARECQERTACVVLVPAPGECLDIAAHSQVIRVRVPDETLAMLPEPVRVGDMTVQRVRAKMTLRTLQPAVMSAAEKQKKRRMAMVAAGGELPSILPPDPGTRLVGDGDCMWLSKAEPNLDMIMKRLKEKGVKCHLGAHGERVLLCGEQDDVVLWKPVGEGRIMVSGPLCDTYFVVRKFVYDLFGLV